jgi:hypothetical protein
MSDDLDLEQLVRILDDLEAESSAVSLPVARDRAVGIARLLVERVAALEQAHGGAATGDRRVVASMPRSVGPLIEPTPSSPRGHVTVGPSGERRSNGSQNGSTGRWG